MIHEAIIGAGVPPVTVTFNCQQPANSVTENYPPGPGHYTQPDQCQPGFVSVTILGVTILPDRSADLDLGMVMVRASVTSLDNGRHMTITVDVKTEN